MNEWTLILSQVKRKKRKKERKKKKEKEEKDCRERHLCLTLPTWLNKADSLKAKEKRKKELFLKSHNYLFGRCLFKLCYILNAPLC